MCPALSISESRYRSRRRDLLSGVAGSVTTPPGAAGAGIGGIGSAVVLCSSSMEGYDVAQKLVRRRVNNVRACTLLGPDGVEREMQLRQVEAARARSGLASTCRDERALMVSSEVWCGE